MSTAYAEPDIGAYWGRLTPRQKRHLSLLINNDQELPPITGEALVLDADPFLALIGSIDDPRIPDDYARNSDFYASEAVRRRHARRA